MPPLLKSGVFQSMTTVEWGSTTNWEVSFPSDPMAAPFREYIPAQTINTPHGSVTEQEISFGNKTAQIPLGTSAEQISVTFLDNDEDVVLNYFSEWMAYLTDGGTATETEAARLMVYTRANNSLTSSNDYAVRVYPMGELTSEMGETAGVRQVSVTFRVVSMGDPQ